MLFHLKQLLMLRDNGVRGSGVLKKFIRGFLYCLWDLFKIIGVPLLVFYFLLLDNGFSIVDLFIYACLMSIYAMFI